MGDNNKAIKQIYGFECMIEVVDGIKYCTAKNHTNVQVRFIVNHEFEEDVFIERWLREYIGSGLRNNYVDDTLIKEEYN